MSGRQTTLLQTWGYEGNKIPLSRTGSSSANEGTDADVFDDDDDAVLNQALEMSLMEQQRPQVQKRSISGSCTPSHSTTSLIPNSANRSGNSFYGRSSRGRGRGRKSVTPLTNLIQTVEPVSSHSSALLETSRVIHQSLKELPDFDTEAGKNWIYPTNYPERKYQYDIVRACLMQNTLVALPTGLGKTFIAAVVMYNFYRWYPSSKLIFMAPTKPLVAQQIEACFKIMGVPQEDMMEMTGNVSPKIREKGWLQKRVLFMTPQVMSNDLNRGFVPTTAVKLLVVDEAHKAQGDYAYCQVVKELEKSGALFRVMALSATPGKDLKSVRDMIQNLMISHVELRSEESPDITPYTFERQIEKIVVPMGQELSEIINRFIEVLRPVIKRLSMKGALYRRGNSDDPRNHTKYGLIQSRNEVRQNPPQNLKNFEMNLIEADFAAGISLYHAYELLQRHGMRPFYNFLTKSINEEGTHRRLKAELSKSAPWKEISEKLSSKFADDINNSRLNSSRPQVLTQLNKSADQEELQSQIDDLVSGHPKLEKLRSLVLDHFKRKKEEKVETRVMIFSEYRDSVQEISACLDAYKPLIKVMEFVGQAGVKGKKGLSQKEQAKVVKRFREGGYNTLVSTCVGEEGLDIGEVDLIVCFDVSKSPIRLVQRMGRTGRKRAGRIIVLVAQGKEEQTYVQSMSSKSSVNRAILEKNKLADALVPSLRLVPDGYVPECKKLEMITREFSTSVNGRENKEAKKQESAKKKEPKKKSSKKVQSEPSNNRRISSMLKKKKSDEDQEENAIMEVVSGKTEQTPPNDPLVTVDPAICGVEESKHDSDLSDIETEILLDLERKIEQGRFLNDPILENESFPTWLMPQNENELEEIGAPPDNFDPEVIAHISEEEIWRFDFQRVVREKLCIKELPATSLVPPKLEKSIIQPEEWEEFNFDVSELEKEFQHEDINHQSTVDDLGRTSPVFSSQSKPRSSGNPTIQKTSTPNFCKRQISRRDSARKMLPVSLSNFSKFDVSEKCESGMEMLLADSGFSFDDNKPEKNEESLYTASQLVSMIQKNDSDHSVLNRSMNNQEGSKLHLASETAKSFSPIRDKTSEDIFLSHDDDIFRDMDVSFGENCVAAKNNHDKEREVQEQALSKKFIFKNDSSSVAPAKNDSIALSQSPLIVDKKKKTSNMLESSGDLENPTASNECERKSVRHDPSFNLENEGDITESPILIKPKKQKRKNKFFLSQAEVSDDGFEHYDEDDAIFAEHFEESFVNDATQADGVNIHAMYLQAVRSPRRPEHSRKLPPVTSDIFSQAPEPEDSYMDGDDSFVARSDSDIEYESKLDELDMIEELDHTILATKVPEKGKKKENDRNRRKRIANAMLSSSDDESVVLEPTPKKPKEESDYLAAKLARLQKQKELKEAFQRKMLSASSHVMPKPTTSLVCDKEPVPSTSHTKTPAEKSLLNENVGPTILVSTTEVHKAHEVLSQLKHEYKISVHVRNLGKGPAHYLASSRMGIFRATLSWFVNCANRRELIEKCQMMNDNYERPVVIVESDKMVDDVFVRSIHTVGQPRTKYVDAVMAQISLSNLRVLYTNSQEETADIIVSLQKREASSSHDLPTPFRISDHQEKLIPFFRTLPGVGFGTALKFATQFSSLKGFLSASPKTISERVGITINKAKTIWTFLRTI